MDAGALHECLGKLAGGGRCRCTGSGGTGKHTKLLKDEEAEEKTQEIKRWAEVKEQVRLG